jgi:hypothetical protein
MLRGRREWLPCWVRLTGLEEHRQPFDRDCGDRSEDEKHQLQVGLARHHRKCYDGLEVGAEWNAAPNLHGVAPGVVL